MRGSLFILLLFACLGLPSCGRHSGVEREDLDPGLVREIQALGNRNWIVIADQSFPLHTRRGVRTLIVDKEIPEVLGGVLDVLESQQHVSPIFYRTRELNFVENDAAPGIDSYRTAVDEALRGHHIRDFQYRYLSVVLEDDSKIFAVLVIKTKTALPYSSIFIELDSGFWDQKSEEQLRKKMESSPGS
ncbi:RbsD/FucU domain-containing protein [Roseibacillus persicicus]|uniref:RbsD/FucU domain-containing protein n=1 Tax=Roseibacillus persicicus TaxID=454148 RepID=UPI00167739C0|nr:RbsD/FucU domain-containing protein [Roseibacillus persicicus]